MNKVLEIIELILIFTLLMSGLIQKEYHFCYLALMFWQILLLGKIKNDKEGEK